MTSHEGPGATRSQERRTVFGNETTVVRFNNAEFYVPDYARHRPVAQTVLDGRNVSPALHQFVGRLLEARPGSMVHAGTFFGDMLSSFSRKTPGVVYAFEPVVENYLLARAVVETNHLGNVLLMHSGLGAATAGGGRALGASPRRGSGSGTPRRRRRGS